MPLYAQDTTVSVARSRAEIEDQVSRYGASGFVSGVQHLPEGSVAAIAFEAQGRRVQFELKLPSKSEFATRTQYGRTYERTPEDIERRWEQACRQRWRALALVVKAKLEAVECGIASFESEFLANIVLANGKTVGKWLLPQLDDHYSKGKMPPLLPAG